MLKMRLIIGTLLAVAIVGLLLLDDHLDREVGLRWPLSFCVLIGLAAAASLYELATRLRRRQWRVYELPTLAAVGNLLFKAVAMLSVKTATFMPLFSTASTAMIPGPPALVIIATRLPLGIGCIAKAVAKSNSSSKVSARITPERIKAAP